MRTFIKTAFIFLFTCLASFAQNSIKNALQGEWIKDKITLRDGSPVYDPAILSTGFSLDFRGDSLIVSVNGVNSLQSFKINDSIISYRSTHYKIVRLEKPILEVVQVNQPQDVEPLKITFIYKPIHDLSTNPEFYLAKNGEPVYTVRPDVIEPKFIHSSLSPVDFIYSYFRFPEYKKGGFVARFIITKAGKMEGLRIEASSDQRYDQRLVDAIKRTEGKWLPAKFQGQPVNAEVEYNFDLGWSKPNVSQDEVQLERMAAEEFFSYGEYYFMSKNYRSAIYYFDKTIEKNPYSVEAYYMRAASHVLRKDTANACKDYLTLKNLDQKKAADLYDQYCSDYKVETTDEYYKEKTEK